MRFLGNRKSVLIVIFVLGALHLGIDLYVFEFGLYAGIIRNNFLYEIISKAIPMIYLHEIRLTTPWWRQWNIDEGLVVHIVNCLSIMWIYILISVVFIISKGLFNGQEGLQKEYKPVSDVTYKYYRYGLPVAVLILVVVFPIYTGDVRVRSHYLPSLYSDNFSIRVLYIFVNYFIFYWYVVFLGLHAHKIRKVK